MEAECVILQNLQHTPMQLKQLVFFIYLLAAAMVINNK